jgi:septal ring factor EnvC (AmiA/AmiB activator)
MADVADVVDRVTEHVSIKKLIGGVIVSLIVVSGAGVVWAMGVSKDMVEVNSKVNGNTEKIQTVTQVQKNVNELKTKTKELSKDIEYIKKSQGRTEDDLKEIRKGIQELSKLNAAPVQTVDPKDAEIRELKQQLNEVKRSLNSEPTNSIMYVVPEPSYREPQIKTRGLYPQPQIKTRGLYPQQQVREFYPQQQLQREQFYRDFRY